MRKWCLIIIVFLALASIVSAQTVSTAELKSVLIDSIKDYLSSQTPKLEKAELKDLIVVYLSTKGDAADLSGIGPFSGKKFIDVYNKAKGITPSQNCTTAGGTCKPNACSTYNNCNAVSVNCDSGYCCTGSCTTNEPVLIPPNTPEYTLKEFSYIPLSDTKRRLSLSCSKTMQYFVINIPASLEVMSIRFSGKHQTNEYNIDPSGIRGRSLNLELTHIQTGKKWTSSNTDINLRIPTNTDSIPSGKYLLTAIFDPVTKEALCPFADQYSPSNRYVQSVYGVVTAYY